RAFDVGIAEQHAVTLSAGMATQGMVVFCNIYSTFLQRAYDQIIHDVALQNLPVIFCLDRSGLVGEDGATHHGVFDLAYLRCIPNMIIYSPRNEIELRNMLYTAQLGLSHPIAIRYPRGRGEIINWCQTFQKIDIGKASLLTKGKKVAILSNGFIGRNITLALTQLENAELFSQYDFPFVKPLDETLLHIIFKEYSSIITIEEGTILGGFGSAIAEFKSKNNYIIPLKILGIPDQFIEQGTIDELQRFSEINVKSLISILSTY
ncbi:MAG: 1-deoxy-D-xylulose-5-phosphate synthase, partial [Flavobacterium sp.]|nr:1-deoxy-D-xylulose-5-phosphate synthase [Flavobacterium sp.]